MKSLAFLFLVCQLLGLSAAPGLADPPEVVEITAERAGMGWRIDVTLKHADTGWEHYADGWEVLDAEGNTLALRELMHPHVNEQPFTRSLTNVMVPDGQRVVFVRSRCNAEGWSSDLHQVTLRY